MVKQVRRWLPGRPIVIVTDSAFCALDFLSATKSHVTAITRLRLDAALYALAPQRLPVVPLRWVLIRDPLKHSSPRPCCALTQRPRLRSSCNASCSAGR